MRIETADTLTLQPAPYEPSEALNVKLKRRLLKYRAQRRVPVKLDRPIVSFSFDDFPRSAIRCGAKALEREGWLGTFYVATGLMGAHNHHGENFLAEDISYLIRRGHEIGAHSHGHLDAAANSHETIMQDILRNEAELKKLGITAPIRQFAYPYGQRTAALKRALGRRYQTLRGVTPGVHRGHADFNDLQSAQLFSGPKLSQTLALIESLKDSPGWLTLFTHDIVNAPSAWGCTPEEFMTCIKAVKSSGARVLTIGAAADIVEARHG